TFTEIRLNRRFNDGAVRLRHQSPHSCELTDLLARTPGTRVGHHKDRIEASTGVLLLTLAEALSRNTGHHVGSDTIPHIGPNIDRLIVALTRGDKTFLILQLDLLDTLFSFSK